MKKKFDKLSNEEKIELLFDLVNAFSIVKTPNETAFFMQDLLTANEIRNLAKRLRIAKLYLSGKSQRKIVAETKTSLATVNKVVTWLNMGGRGFKNVLVKLPLKYEKPGNLPRGPIEYFLPQMILGLTEYAIAEKQEKPVTGLISEINKKEKSDKEMRTELNEYFKARRFLKKAS